MLHFPSNGVIFDLSAFIGAELLLFGVGTGVGTSVGEETTGIGAGVGAGAGVGF